MCLGGVKKTNIRQGSTQDKQSINAWFSLSLSVPSCTSFIPHPPPNGSFSLPATLGPQICPSPSLSVSPSQRSFLRQVSARGTQAELTAGANHIFMSAKLWPTSQLDQSRWYWWWFSKVFFFFFQGIVDMWHKAESWTYGAQSSRVYTAQPISSNSPIF